VPVGIYSRLRIIPSLSLTLSFLFSWAVQSIICASLLYQIGIVASWTPYRRDYLRFVLAIMMGIGLVAKYGLITGSELTIVGFALVEFNYRGASGRLGKRAATCAGEVLCPAKGSYLFRR
jgi:hypothetical protein